MIHTINNKKNNWKKVFSIALISSIFLMSCEKFMGEEYDDIEYFMTPNDTMACSQLDSAETSLIDTANGLRVFGPQWISDNISEAFISNERIGETWINSDNEVAMDVFVVDVAGAYYGVSILQSNITVVDGNLSGVDSIYVVYKHINTSETSFDTTPDTLIVEYSSATTLYLYLNSGFVGVNDDWTLSFTNANIAMNAGYSVARLEGKELSDVSTVPDLPFLSDGAGIAEAFSYIEAQNNTYLQTDSAHVVELLSNEKTGYAIIDGATIGAGEYTLYASDFMDIKVFASSGEEVDFVSDNIPTITTTICSYIKIKEKYALEAEKYLVQFTPSEQMDSNIFNLIILVGGE